MGTPERVGDEAAQEIVDLIESALALAGFLIQYLLIERGGHRLALENAAAMASITQVRTSLPD
jgi:hypothetical protein